MKYIYWAIPGLLAGRPGPDEIDWNLSELKEAGFGAILSLHNSPVGLENIHQNGFVHELLPLPASIPPVPEDILTSQQLLPEALTFLHRHVASRIPILVHCHASKDRTGVVLACYLCTHEKPDPPAAIRKLRAVKTPLLSAEGYEALVYQLLDSQYPGTA